MKPKTAIIIVTSVIALGLATIFYIPEKHAWTAWGRIQVAGGWYHWRRCLNCGKAQIEWWREWTKSETAMIATNQHADEWMDGYFSARRELVERESAAWNEGYELGEKTAALKLERKQ